MDGSPPTRRVIDVMRLLANQTEPLSITEISAQTGVPRATARSIIVELEAAGWVRDRGKRTFSLGAEIASLTACADVTVPRVRDELDRLAREAQCGVSLCRVANGTVTVVQRVGNRSDVPGFHPGRTWDLLFPAGAGVMPWRPRAERERWMAAAHDPERAIALLQVVRDNGVAVFRPANDNASLIDVLADLVRVVGTGQDGLRERAMEQIVALSSQPYTDDDYASRSALPISYLTAAVRDGDRADYELQLAPLRPAVPVAQRHQLINLIGATAARLAPVLL